MKKFLKKILLASGLLDAARFVYNAIRGISLDMVFHEVKFRIAGLPDKHPAPSMKLVFLIIGTPWLFEYWYSGVKIFQDLISQLERNSIRRDQFKRILDFGCGCARLTRQMTCFPNAKLYGSDYNPVLIDWCSRKLTFGEFAVNNIAPPLPYENNYFDLVTARSVFTHLGYDLQLLWMSDLYRVIAPGGYLYFTTHGIPLMKNLTIEEVDKFQKGELVVQRVGLEGDNKCSSFESKEWVLKHLLGKFRFVDFVEGRPDKHLKQDIFIFQKP